MAILSDYEEDQQHQQSSSSSLSFKKDIILAEKEADAIAKKPEEEKKQQKENKLVPSKDNGLDMENYSWGQSLQVVTVNVLRDQSEWWKSLLEADLEIDTQKADLDIDTQKAELEPRKLSDLDSKTHFAMEKMMFDQRQKQMGLPTSDEIPKEKLMKQFMAQNPNMKFPLGAKFM
ncbi:hypothetical protein SO802_002157 [Lithocarpus litseifolius]|uniref:Uncharacterized protein n=1 Tax=Lithocarpus litseifolius TaxID=425828 RepID=A0AAW2DZY5_9ROSI